MKQYTLINTNTLLNKYKYENCDDVLYKMLELMDDYLKVMINNNITVQKINFDHLLCVEKFNDVVCDVIKFDTIKLQFYRTDSIVCNFNNNLTYLFKNVVSNLKKVLMNNTKQKHKTQHIEAKVIDLNKKAHVELNKKEHVEVKEKEYTKKELQQMMNDIIELKNKETTKIESLKEKAEEKCKEIENKSNEMGDIIRETTKNKDKEEENKNVFIANKKAYYLIKQDIKDHKLLESAISPLFKDVYPIYKFMDQNELLEQEDEYAHYIMIYNELYPKNFKDNYAYIPHNVNYLDEKEKEKYDRVKDKTDIIDKFMNNEKKSLGESSEEIIADACNDVDFGDVNFD